MIFSLDAIDIAVLVATILGVGMLVPQARGMTRTRDFRGVSGAWIGGGLAINVGWFVYALAAGLHGLLPVSVGALVLYGWMAALLATDSPHLFQRSVIGAGAVGVLFALAGVAGGLTAFGLVIALTYSAQFAPAAWSALVADDLSGVSTSTWVMALTEAVIWASYGAYQGDTALMVGGSGASIMSIVVIAGLLFRRGTPTRRRPQVLQPS